MILFQFLNVYRSCGPYFFEFIDLHSSPNYSTCSWADCNIFSMWGLSNTLLILIKVLRVAAKLQIKIKNRNERRPLYPCLQIKSLLYVHLNPAIMMKEKKIKNTLRARTACVSMGGIFESNLFDSMWLVSYNYSRAEQKSHQVLVLSRRLYSSVIVAQGQAVRNCLSAIVKYEFNNYSIF